MSISTTLAPFIVWLASRERDETVRRRIREHVERFLVWAEAHHLSEPPAGEQDRRCEHYLREYVTDPRQLTGARLALERYQEHRSILARTAIVGR
jgi:hypothetical protein